MTLPSTAWLTERLEWIQTWDIDSVLYLFAMSVVAGCGFAIPVSIALWLFT